MIRVLLVEDDPNDLILARRVLADHPDLRVEHVTNLAAARGHLAADATDCVLLDLQLPDATPDTTVAQVHAAVPDVPVVVLTGHEDEAGGVQALADGAQDYVVKGRYDGPGLVRAIRYAVVRKQAELETVRRAVHDDLTGLPNRTLLRDRLAHSLARLERTPGCVGVLFCDLDGFKAINDGLGHAVGDDILIQCGTRLQRAVRPTDTVARYGGDEFVVLLEDLSAPSDAGIVAGRLGAVVRERFVITGQTIDVAASIGVAVATSAWTQPDDLLAAADGAMYRAKRLGPGRVEHAGAAA